MTVPAEPPHGTNSRYARGCRCTKCVTVHNRYVATRNAQRQRVNWPRRQKIGGCWVATQPGLKHGSEYVYTNFGCRCEECTAGTRERSAQKRKQHYAERVLIDGYPTAVRPGLVHGTSTTYNTWGCRCVVCREARAQVRRLGHWPDPTTHRRTSCSTTR